MKLKALYRFDDGRLKETTNTFFLSSNEPEEIVSAFDNDDPEYMRGLLKWKCSRAGGWDYGYLTKMEAVNEAIINAEDGLKRRTETLNYLKKFKKELSNG